MDALGIATNRLEGLVVDRKAQLGSESNGAHHAQRVVREGDVGVARSANQTILHILHPVEGIDQLTEALLGERPGQRIDREVATTLIILKRTGLNERFARVVGVALTASTDKLHLHPIAGAQHGRTKGLIDRNLGAQLTPQRLGQRNTATHDHHIDIGRGATEVVIAHITAYDIGIHALLLGDADDMTKYGIRQWHSVLF